MGKINNSKTLDRDWATLQEELMAKSVFRVRQSMKALSSHSMHVFMRSGQQLLSCAPARRTSRKPSRFLIGMVWKMQYEAEVIVSRTTLLALESLSM